MSYDEYLQNKCDRYNEQQGRLLNYDCPKCRNKGYVAFIRDGVQYMHECECMPLRNSLRRIASSGIERLLKDYTLESFRADTPWQEAIKRKAEGYLQDHDSKWFVIGGQVGCGKTHICTAIVGKMMDQGKSARYMLWRDEVVRLKANVNEDRYGNEMEKLKRVGVLYIDDFFKTKAGDRPTAADVNIAFELLNSRYTNRLATIISSERTAGEIMDIDEAVGSRIIERSRGYCTDVARDPGKNQRIR